MKGKIWINKTNSFEEAGKFDIAYYLNLSSADRLETIQILREAYFKSTGGLPDENGKRLRRILRVVKQASGSVLYYRFLRPVLPCPTAIHERY